MGGDCKEVVVDAKGTNKYLLPNNTSKESVVQLLSGMILKASGSVDG